MRLRNILFHILAILCPLIHTCCAPDSPSSKPSQNVATSNVSTCQTQLCPPARPTSFITEPHYSTDISFFLKLVKAFNHFSTPKLPELIDQSIITSETTRIPFKFPRFESYGLEQAERMARMTHLEAKRITIVLTKTIYRLLQFHVKRLFGLKAFDYAVPRTQRYHQVEWDRNPEHWFSAMLYNILPGAVMSLIECSEESRVSRMHVEAFDFIQPGTIVNISRIIVGELTREENHLAQTGTSFLVSIYSLPRAFWNKVLPPGFTILTAIRYYDDIQVVNMDLLEYLLRGVEFTYDSSGNTFEILVTATDELTSVEESRKHLNEFFTIPLSKVTSLPPNIEACLKNFQTPRLSCYHYGSFPSTPLVYETMLTQILASELTRELEANRFVVDWHYIALLMDTRMKQFLPKCTVAYEIIILENDKMDICKWDKTSKHFVIYEEERGKYTKHSLILDIGHQQQHLTMKQMAEIKGKVFPRVLSEVTIEAGKGPLLNIVRALYSRLKVAHSGETLTSVPKKENKKQERMSRHSRNTTRRQRRNIKAEKGGTVFQPNSIIREPPPPPLMNVFPRIAPSDDMILTKLNEISLRLSTRNYDSNNILKVLSEMTSKMNGFVGSFHVTQLSLPKDLDLTLPNSCCQIINTLYPMVPYPSGTIFAYLPDGRVGITKRPLVFLPRIPSGDYYLWFDNGEQFEIGSRRDDLLSKTKSAFTDSFALR